MWLRWQRFGVMGVYSSCDVFLIFEVQSTVSIDVRLVGFANVVVDVHVRVLSLNRLMVEARVHDCQARDLVLLTFFHSGRHLPLLFWRSWRVHGFLVYLGSHCQSWHGGSLVQPLDRILMRRVASWPPVGAKATGFRNIFHAPNEERVTPALTSFRAPPNLVNVVYIFSHEIDFRRPFGVSALKRIEILYLLKRLYWSLNLAKLWILWPLNLSIGSLCGI